MRVKEEIYLPLLCAAVFVASINMDGKDDNAFIQLTIASTGTAIFMWITVNLFFLYEKLARRFRRWRITKRSKVRYERAKSKV